MIMNSKAEEIRLRYLYRTLILKGEIRLPFEAAKRLIGPDCAFHLYSVTDLKEEKEPPPADKKEL